MKKIVISLTIHNDKCRTKALRTVAKAKGVVSMSLEEDQLVVTGNVDSVCLTTVLRRKFCNATLQSVEDLKEEEEEEEEETKPKEDVPVCFCNYRYGPSPGYEVVLYDPNPNTCSIL